MPTHAHIQYIEANAAQRRPPGGARFTVARPLCFLPSARRCVLAAGLFLLLGCDRAPEPTPLYYAPDHYSPAALRSSSDDAARCIDLIESGRVMLSGSDEEVNQVKSRLYAICARGDK